MKPFLLRSSWRRLTSRFASTAPKSPTYGPGLHEYTSGRFLFNEERRLRERRLNFNVHELANIICRTLDRPFDELKSIEKFAEGGFNRILQATFNDGREVLAKIPFRLEAPMRRSVASEAATLSILHDNGLPVPKLLGYSAFSDNAAGIEYILLDKLPGKPLANIWFSLTNKAVGKIMKQIFKLEQKYMSLAMPACGSLFFRQDLEENQKVIPLKEATRTRSPVVVGPMTDYAWEYRERAELNIDRGPWEGFLSCFEAGARRELAFCNQYGRPRLNAELYLRGLDNLELQHPSMHARLLEDFLRIAPGLCLDPQSRFARPTLRHPDLSPNNILVNEHNDIVGIIDWQHTVVLPLALCAGIPKHFQNWSDAIMAPLTKPKTKLQPNFESLSPGEQAEIRETLRRSLVHWYYAAISRKHLQDHYDAFLHPNSVLRAKLYARASAPWEGSSTSLESILIEAQQHWPRDLDGASKSPSTPCPKSPSTPCPKSPSTPCPTHYDGNTVARLWEILQKEGWPTCPIQYDGNRVARCWERLQKEGKLMEELDDIKALLGIDSVGWVPTDKHLKQAKEMRETIRKVSIEDCENDMERKAVLEHFAFDDHEE